MDYEHAKRVYKEFKLQNLGDYQDLYVKSDTLLLADVFEYLRDKCIEIYELDPAHVLSAPGLERSKIRIINRYWYVIDGWKRN